MENNINIICLAYLVGVVVGFCWGWFQGRISLLIDRITQVG